MQTETTKQIIRINASALKQSSCLLHFYLTVIEGYKQSINYNDIEFGSAVHIFLKVMYETNGRFDEAIKAARGYFESTKMLIKPKKKYLDTQHLMGVCIKYWHWIQDNDTFEVLQMENGKPAVEITFSNKYYEDDHFIIYLEGTIDKIGKFKNGCYAIGDYKTTSSWDKEEYLSNYALSPQLMFYHFNLLEYAKNNPCSLIDTIVKYPVGQFIDGVFLCGKDKTDFARSEIFLPKKHDFDTFKIMLDSFINKLLYHVRDTSLQIKPEGKLNGACTTVYGRCKFFNVCAAPDDIARGHILKQTFIKTEYLPLKVTADKDL